MKPGKTDSDITQIIDINSGSNHRNGLKHWVFIALPVVIIIILMWIWKTSVKTSEIQFKTEQVRRGDLTVIVTATGTLEPTNEVEVGSELSGIIENVEVDYNDRVKAGQILAKLDTSILETQIKESEAVLESAKANILQAKASLEETRSELERFKQVRKLSNGKVPSQSEFDKSQATFRRAKAEYASSKAAVSKAEATLDTYKTRLYKSTIYSPIDGVVLTREIEPGQTVAASFATPVLFTLAEDLTQMEVHVNVDESDIGQVKERQDAIFTVDAYPNRKFEAQITEIRYGAETVDGVVTYETVLKVDNTDLSLRPGMTATADIYVMKIESALMVPNSALRFKMPRDNNEKNNRGLVSAILPRPPMGKSKPRENAIGNGRQYKIWILKDAQPVPISVTTGVTDGVNTEIVDGEIDPGMSVIVDIIS